MKKLFTFLFFLTFLQASFAQEEAKVIFHLQSADTLVYKSVFSQIKNLKKEMPTTAIEILCHGPGIDFLRLEKSAYAKNIQHLGFTDISIVGCEFTMSQRKIMRADIVLFASTVPYGVVEIVQRQQEGWIYVKAGF